MKPLCVSAVGLWTPGLPDAAAWLAGRRDPAALLPAAALLAPAVRRRTSLLTRAAIEAFAQAAAAAAVDRAEIATIFVSAWGETSALQELLDQLHGEEGSLSPIRFSGSVHNAASGHVSIAAGNRNFTTSIAAGWDSVAMGLCEALGLLHAGQAEVIAVFADIDAPSPLADSSGHCAPLAVALHLHDGTTGQPVRARLSRLLDTAAVAANDKLDADLRANPCGGALAIADAILHGRGGPVALGGAWSVHVQPEAS